MDKPEWCNDEIWQNAIDAALQVSGWGDIYTSTIVEDIASAILSAQSQAYIDAARIAEKYAGVNMADNARFVARNISAAILQRKEEMK